MKLNVNIQNLKTYNEININEYHNYMRGFRFEYRQYIFF